MSCEHCHNHYDPENCPACHALGQQPGRPAWVVAQEEACKHVLGSRRPECKHTDLDAQGTCRDCSQYNIYDDPNSIEYHLLKRWAAKRSA
jgi:hypothetical protein